MEKIKKLGLLTISLLFIALVPLAMPAAHASPPITWSISRSYYNNGNLIYIVFKVGNLYAEADIYKYYYTSSGWRGGLAGYFTVQGSITWYQSAKVTATAYLCTNGYCYPVKTWESSSVNPLEVYLRQYLQNFFATMCYYTNCWSLVSYVQSLIAPYISSGAFGYILGVPFIYFVYMAASL
jgi:hypothetical protein